MTDRTASDVADSAIIGAVKDMGSKLGSVARDAATTMGESPKTAGADAIEGMGQTVRNVADDIGKEFPVVAGYVRDTASSIGKVADSLREHRISDLLGMVTKFGREQPVAFFAGAIVAGFALSRFVKSGMNQPTADETPERRHDVGRNGV